MSDYVVALCNEIDASYDGQTASGLSTVYFGGGTPSLFSQAQLSIVLAKLRGTFGLQSEAEITLEVNPGTVKASDFDGFYGMGINRISIGVQSFSKVLLGSLGRIHTARQAMDTIMWAKAAGFTNISCDLMTGLPGQTLGDALDSLSILLEYEVPHVSFYALSLEEGTPFYDRYHRHEDQLPDPELEREMYHSMILLLKEHGYNHYEISNCSRPGLESRHNLTYWKALPYYGFGCAAFSYLHGRRIGNTSDLRGYIKSMISPDVCLCDIEEENVEISWTESRKEFMLLGFRLLRGVSAGEFADRFGMPLADVFGAELDGLLAKNLIICQNGNYRLSNTGLDYANQVFCAFV